MNSKLNAAARAYIYSREERIGRYMLEAAVLWSLRDYFLRLRGRTTIWMLSRALHPSHALQDAKPQSSATSDDGNQEFAISSDVGDCKLGPLYTHVRKDEIVYSYR